MKLFTKYNRINIVATILIFLAASIAFYFTLKLVLLNQVDDDLRIEEHEIIAYVKQFKRLPENIKVSDQLISYTPVSSAPGNRSFINVVKRDPVDNDKENFRQLQFGILVSGQWYLASVSKSMEETDDFIRIVVAITCITILTILIVSFIINRFVLKRLWQPFNESLAAVKRFRIGGNETLHFSRTDIDEFKLMNQALADLTKRAQLDYLALKTFSENASHEIQTPVAIIQSKLDILIQDEALTEAQSKTVQDVYDAILRLSRLNSSLLLLAKIENMQYAESEMINLQQKVKEKIADFNELWQSHGIQVTCSLEPSSLIMNPYLAEIMLNNLLSNATKYNHPGGTIAIRLYGTQLLINNTSDEPELDAGRIFQRFYKSSTSVGSHGLGLSVVKQICDASSLAIVYKFNKEVHSFSIEWN
ncbi:MAG TPA: HAMP domain-containing sensor histidine kinase [Flavitalea sp.]|nr:HAMP domain-containing sensor histidine kinase [Flavitalea sp.]